MKKLLSSLIIALSLIAGSAQASSSFACNGNTYTWPDQFVNYQYVTNWPLMMGDCLTQFSNYVTSAAASATSANNAAITATTSSATQATSATSISVGTGSKTFTIQTGKGFIVGMSVRISDQSSPTINYMDGIVISYNSGTGSMAVLVSSASGSGSPSSWNVFLEGPIGPIPVTSGYISGCVLSTAVSTPNTVLDVAACYAADINSGSMITAVASTVNFSSAGSIGQLDTGSMASSTWYAIFACSGTSGSGFVGTKETAGSTPSPSCPTGYNSAKRYVGSVFSNSSTHLAAFTQWTNRFYWATEPQDLASGAASSPTLLTLSVPLGLQVRPLLNLSSTCSGCGGGPVHLSVWSPSLGSGFSTSGLWVGNANGTAASIYAGGEFPDNWITNQSGQLYYKNTSTGLISNIFTIGWVDPYLSPISNVLP